MDVADDPKYKFPGDRQPVRSGREGTHYRHGPVPRLPNPARTDSHQHHGRHSEATGRQGGYPGISTRRVSSGQKEFWWENTTTSTCDGNVEDDRCFTTSSFYLSHALDECLPSICPISFGP